MTDDRFDHIRPFADHEVNAALHELIDHLSFIKVLRYVYPEMTDEAIRAKCADIDSVAQFQKEVSHPAMRLMIDQTIDSLTISGLSEIVAGQGHLYISNHRDIILDSAILNVVLFEAGLKTTETAIGSNLLDNETVRILTKLNKNFTVERGLDGRELYTASSLLSTYIRTKVKEHNESIWISQREGRSKDGNDRTQAGLLKMLAMSGEGHLAQSMAELDIRPLTFSYEYDPCDVFKVKELLYAQRGEVYVKEEEEDLQSIVAGITGRKGRVHVSVGESINGQLALLSQVENKKEQFQALTDILDRAIHRGIKLYPNNYLAADRKEGSTVYTEEYTAEDVTLFDAYLDEVLAPFSTEQRHAARAIMINKYAWPLINKMASILPD